MTPSPTLLQRCALGLWFLGLGALGLLRWWMRYTRDARVEHDPVMLVWLWGSVALVVLGTVWSIRALATRSRERDS